MQWNVSIYSEYKSPEILWKSSSFRNDNTDSKISLTLNWFSQMSWKFIKTIKTYSTKIFSCKWIVRQRILWENTPKYSKWMDDVPWWNVCVFVCIIMSLAHQAFTCKATPCCALCLLTVDGFVGFRTSWKTPFSANLDERQLKFYKKLNNSPASKSSIKLK